LKLENPRGINRNSTITLSSLIFLAGMLSPGGGATILGMSILRDLVFSIVFAITAVLAAQYVAWALGQIGP
jgi:hypothetical protein